MFTKRMLSFAGCGLFMLSNICTVFAKDTRTQKYPAAVLVQLRSEQNRIKAATKKGDYQVVKEIESDANMVTRAMINDFTDHFDYCPVYYYMDTNLQQVLDRHFDGVLMDANRKPARNIVLSDTSTNYLIVYYGYATPQSRTSDKVTDQTTYEYNSGEPNGKGLVINNYKFRQVSYLYRLGFDNFFFKRKKNARNAYESKHYDMEYFPTAKQLETELTENNNKIPISHVQDGIDTAQ